VDPMQVEDRMRYTLVKYIGVALGIVGMWTIPVWAYEESQVERGGTIRGQVTVAGGCLTQWPLIW
jgi:hypothetical protein